MYIGNILQHTQSLYSLQYPRYTCGGKRGFASADSDFARAMLSSAMIILGQHHLLHFIEVALWLELERLILYFRVFAQTVDGVAVGYAKGKLKHFPFNPKLTVDVIPADMVINALIMAMVEYANRSTTSEIIYHVGSSLRNPFKFSNFQELSIRYFAQNPLIDKEGKPIKVGKIKAFRSMATFRIYMVIRYSLPLKVFHLAINTVLFQKPYKDKYTAHYRNLKRGMRLAELYEPYVFFKGIFDDTNSEKLQIAARETCSEADAFNFDPTSVSWEAYMMDVHFPGLVKYVLK
ncbi:alcohol-forming fatty acyl-CoA reductase-like [Populus nigra]|uniref:alcohol-forming fatty acyl-CoA reductase-like n=1 Tax=Populus nigra TaxID=3691 RepID=UPI002B272A9E|nr:alcohol-forming fatty acyl-CoA reductase-like [Populus nigra]